MKMAHISDLHLGKRLNEFSMLEEQDYILKRILGIIKDERVETLLISGDIYDKAVPPVEAVLIFGDFLKFLAEREIKVFIISGNHDSPERISFGSGLFDRSGIYVSPVFDGKMKKVTLQDNYGAVNFYMLPFIKTIKVKYLYRDEEINTPTQAVQAVIDRAEVNKNERNVILSHQFVTGAVCSDSENIYAGGLDNVDANVFAGFDYSALGHLHAPQNMSEGKVRYSGTPLKYSFSEVNHKKSVTIIELFEKNRTEIHAVPLIPKTEMAELRGEFSDLSDSDFYGGIDPDSLLHITLTDEQDIPNAMGKLSAIYPNILKLDYENTRTRQETEILQSDGGKIQTPAELAGIFFKLQNNHEMSDEQKFIISELIGNIWGEADSII